MRRRRRRASNHRLFVCLLSMVGCISFVGLYVSHALLLRLHHNGQAGGSLSNPNQWWHYETTHSSSAIASSMSLPWMQSPVLTDMLLNRTAATLKKCGLVKRRNEQTAPPPPAVAAPRSRALKRHTIAHSIATATTTASFVNATTTASNFLLAQSHNLLHHNCHYPPPRWSPPSPTKCRRDETASTTTTTTTPSTTRYFILLWWDAAAVIDNYDNHTRQTTSTLQSLRTLFVNLLHYLTLPNVVRIHVLILDNETNETNDQQPQNAYPYKRSILQSNAKYGHRILRWHSNVTHKVHLVSLPSFSLREEHDDNAPWSSSMEQQERADTRACAASAVWMMDGGVLYSQQYTHPNHSLLELGLNVWKSHSDSLVATQAWQLQFVPQQLRVRVLPEVRNVSSTTRVNAAAAGGRVVENDHHHAKVEHKQQYRERENATAASTGSSDESFVVVCPDESIKVVATASSSLEGATAGTIDETTMQLHLVDLSGLWVHVNFLQCFFRQYEQPQTMSSSDESNTIMKIKSATDFRMSLSVWLMQVAKSTLHLYDASSPRPAHTDNNHNRAPSNWIDNKALTRLVRTYGGMPTVRALPVPRCKQAKSASRMSDSGDGPCWPHGN